MSKETKAQKIKRLKRRANELYKEMTRATADAQEAHDRFRKNSNAYADVLKQLEQEIQSND